MDDVIVIIFIIVTLIIAWVVAKEFYNVACIKGFSERKYFWYCFLFGVVGYLLVIALPYVRLVNSNNQGSGLAKEYKISTPTTGSEPKGDHKTVANQGYWKCSKCGRDVPAYTGTCACGQEKDKN